MRITNRFHFESTAPIAEATTDETVPEFVYQVEASVYHSEGRGDHVSILHHLAHVASNVHARRRLGASAKIVTSFAELPKRQISGGSMMEFATVLAFLSVPALSFMLPGFINLQMTERRQRL